MTKLNKIKYIAVLCVVSILCACFGFAFAPTTANANVEKQVSSVFDIESMSLRITDQGMRWVAKMDSTTYENITTKDNVSLHFVIAPKVLMDAANGDYMGMEKKILINVDDYSKMYSDGDFWFVNGAVNNLKAENKELDYTAVAVIGTTANGVTTYEYTSTKISNSAYGLANWAIVNGALETEDAAKILNTYSYLGTESNPIACENEEQVENILAINDGEVFADKYIKAPCEDSFDLFAANEKGYSYKVDYSADSVISQNSEVATYVDGKIIAGEVGETTLTAIIDKADGVKIAYDVQVSVKSIPNVVLSAPASITGFSNRDLKGDNDTVMYKTGNYKELSPSVTIDGQTVSNPYFTFTIKDEEGSHTVVPGKTNTTKHLSTWHNGYFLSITDAHTRGNIIIEVSYVDSYGVSYSQDVAVDINWPLWYGTDSRYKSNDGVSYEGIFAEVPATYTAVRFDNVELTNSKDSQIVRMQYIPTVSVDRNGFDVGAPVPGPQMMFISIIDSENENNYVTFIARRHYHDYLGSQVGARASTWANNSGCMSNAEAAGKHPSGSVGIGGGWAGTCGAFSFFGEYIGYPSEYKNYASIGIAMEGTTMYVHHKDNVTKVIDFVADASNANVNEPEWTGFDSNKVDIMIGFAHGSATGKALVYVDMLGGKTVTGINNDMYFVRNWTAISGGTAYKPA